MMLKHLLLVPFVMFVVVSAGMAQHTHHSSQAELRKLWIQAFERIQSNQSAFIAPSDDNKKKLLQERRNAVLKSTTPFVEPRVVASTNGHFPTSTLNVRYEEFQIGQDRVWLRTYSGGLVGPTFRVRPGDVLRIRLRNQLPHEPHHHGDHNQLHGFNTTNLHTHGLHVSPSGRSDNVLLRIGPGEEFDYRIEIPDDHPAGTFWYHAHSHGSVAAHVSSGMSGAIIVEGDLDDVPEIAKAKEKVFVLQQIPYVMEDGIGVVEQRYAAESFAPGAWDKLGRHTTVNGQLFPVIRMRPGELQRWRMIHSGVREGIGLRLQGFEGDAKGVTVPLHEIAWDGLPLERIPDAQNRIVELFPGYRVDVLVKPEKTGVYLLEDALIPDVAEFTQDPNYHPKYLAKVIVEGDAAEMKLPSNEQLAKVKDTIRLLDDLSSIAASKVGKQTAVYTIDAPPLRFMIDDNSFDPKNVRRLKLNSVDEWVLESKNPVGPVDHPFHIHVNPFQITKVVDAMGRERPEMIGWRDTLLLRHEWKYTVRMKYQRFTGTFVQHCHILDHEDQGMMQLVEIYREAVGRRP
ncbi:MAG TPA: multicopper oxidase family protein [Pirellulaceae bacterium]|nr:multicopper oxidase family protein [Pirellulaceae bacterium]